MTDGTNDPSEADSGGGCKLFHKLLPNISEAIEALDEATVQEVQKKIEDITSIKYSLSELILGLENGTHLGLFDVEREFTINSDYLKSELKMDEYDRRLIAALVKKRIRDGEIVTRDKFDVATRQPQPQQQQHHQQQQQHWLRKVRSRDRKRTRSNQSYREDRAGGARRKLRICDRCKKKIEGRSADSRSEADDSLEESISSNKSMSPSDLRPMPKDSHGRRAASHRKISPQKWKKTSITPEKKIKGSNQIQQQNQRKSRLLVVRNPLESDPPYYDIFT